MYRKGSRYIPYVETECGKFGYRSKSAANRAAKNMKFQKKPDASIGIHSYFCKECRYFHVGHQIGSSNADIGATKNVRKRRGYSYYNEDDLCFS